VFGVWPAANDGTGESVTNVAAQSTQTFCACHQRDLVCLDDTIHADPRLQLHPQCPDAHYTW
jgi:hypothetical protein